MKKTGEIKVFISTRESICDECKEELGRNAGKPGKEWRKKLSRY